ncbi:MAG: NAD(P)H-binding protein [Phycisphaerae bacterium]|nr:NAD(P)H-binding protein [Phycisphaerae bacterium]
MSEAGAIAVTGATGFVGRHVVRALLARGRSVRGLVRDAAKARAVLPASDTRLTLVRGDLDDDAAVRSLLAGASACVHTVGIIREEGRNTFARVHVEFTRRVLSAAAASGAARRFVLISALGVHPDGPSAYQRTKFEGETLVRRSGLDWTILRPGMIHGAEGEFIRMAAGWARGERAPYWFMPYFVRTVDEDEGVPLGRQRREPARLAPVAVEDVADAVGAALDSPRAVGEVYPLVGPETLDWREMMELLRDEVPRAEASQWIVPIPAELAAAAARAAAAVGLEGLLPFNEGMARMAALDATASCAKAREHLGVEPRRAFRPTLRAYASAIR